MPVYALKIQLHRVYLFNFQYRNGNLYNFLTCYNRISSRRRDLYIAEAL